MPHWQAADGLQCPRQDDVRIHPCAPEGPLRGHQLAAAYQEQLNAVIQLNGDLLQEVTAAAEQIADCLWPSCIAHEFVDEVRDAGLNQHFLMGEDRSLKAVLKQALHLEAAKAAARFQFKKSITVQVGIQPPIFNSCRERRPVFWQCGEAVHLMETVSGHLAMRYRQSRLEKALCNRRSDQCEERCPRHLPCLIIYNSTW